MNRQYYSHRTGQHPGGESFDLDLLRGLFLGVFQNLESVDYFQEALGKLCVDEGHIPGSLGTDVETSVFLALQKRNMWPIHEHVESFVEHDIFDLIEFLFDIVSKPTDGTYHSWNECGWHYTEFDKAAGQAEFRDKINSILPRYGDGFTLSPTGEVERLAAEGLEPLVQAELPAHDPENVEARVKLAAEKFRSYRASLDDRRMAVRDLADVLEFLRPKVKAVLTRKNESDLFELANSFGIRHHNEKQKTSYDQAIWLSWMFYHYLATIHACIRLIEKHKAESR